MISVITIGEWVISGEQELYSLYIYNIDKPYFFLFFKFHNLLTKLRHADELIYAPKSIHMKDQTEHKSREKRRRRRRRKQLVLKLINISNWSTATIIGEFGLMLPIWLGAWQCSYFGHCERGCSMAMESQVNLLASLMAVELQLVTVMVMVMVMVRLVVGMTFHWDNCLSP